MTNEIRNRVLVELGDNFTSEQLKMIDLAVAKALFGFVIKKEETLPVVADDASQMMIKEFIARKKIKGCAKGTIKLYQSVVKDFASYIRKDLNKVIDIDILMYLDYVETKKRLAKRTMDSKRLVLSSFYTFMHTTGKMNYNPMSTIDRIKSKENVRQPLTDIELEKVRNACVTLREKALFEVLYSTGARVSEVASMNFADIDKEHRSIVILGKGNYERVVYFNAKSMLAIENYMTSRTDDNPALFVQNKAPHKRLGRSAIEVIVHKLGLRSSIGRRVFPHLMRHTMATDALSRGAKIDEVSALLGHKKLETTKIYAKINAATLKMAHTKCLA